MPGAFQRPAFLWGCVEEEFVSQRFRRVVFTGVMEFSPLRVLSPAKFETIQMLVKTPTLAKTPEVCGVLRV